MEVVYNKPEILNQLELRFQQINDLIKNTPHDQLQQPRGDKWSVAQLVHHIIITTASVASMLKYAPAMLKMRFGAPDHSSRPFNEVRRHYNDFFLQPRKAPEKYVPKSDAKLDQETLISDWNSVLPKFRERLTKWSEADLDNYGAPHPVVNNLTVREHLYVAILHIDLHIRQLKEEL